MSSNAVDGEDLRARLRRQDWIDEPFTGFTGFEAFAAGSPVWPDERWARIEDRGSFTDGRRDVRLFTFVRDEGTPAAVPVGFVFDLTNEDNRVRVYYNKEHFGSREPRRPLVAPESAPLPPALEAYLHAIRSGDRSLLSAVVDPSALFHSPRGTISGAAFIDAFSDTTPSVTAGVPLEICTVTADETGASFAVEFISWRRPPHGGLSVYTFDDGRLGAMDIFEGPVRR